MNKYLNEDIYEKINEHGTIKNSVDDQDILKEICKLIFEHSYDMISLLDKESSPIFINKAHKRILGYDEDFLLDKNALELFHPEDRETAKDEWFKVIEEKEDRDMITGRYKAKDGSYIWLETHLKTLTDKDEDVKFVLCISRDISDKVEAKKELEKNKEKVEKLHDVAYELDTCRTEGEVFDIILDAAETILNFDYISIFKKVEEGFEAKCVSYEIRPKLKGNIYDKNNYTWQTYITGKSFLVEDIDSESYANAGLTEYKSGLSIPIGEYGVFQALSKEKYRYTENDLELAELLVSHMNQTIKRINYQSELEKSEKRYRSIFENTGTAMVIIEEDTTIALANEEVEKLTGYSKEEIEGVKSFKECLVKEDVEKITRYHHVRRHNNEAVPQRYNARLVTKYGDVRDIIVIVGMIPESNKSIVSLLDFTKSRKNLKALSESEEAFRIAFDKSLVGLIRLDKNSKIMDINEKACDLLSKSEEEVLNKKLEDVLKLKNQKKFLDQLGEVIEGEHSEFDLFLERGGGNKKFNIRANPITDIDGETKFILLQIK